MTSLCQRRLNKPTLAAQTAGWFFALVSLLASPAPAQVVWAQRTSATSPSPRYWYAMAYDEARHRVVLFGGQPGPACGIRGDTWEWDGTSWTEFFPRSSPPPRGAHVMAYCPVRGRIVLFGGFDCSGALGDTWEWDGINWIQQSPPVAPIGRVLAAMAQDDLGNVILFGGAGHQSQNHFSDTWEWNGQWTQRTPATSPSPRKRHTMAFDVRRRGVVLYGGDRSPTRYNDTWEWRNGNWVERMPSSTPPLASNGPTMAYDFERDRVVLYLWSLAASASEVWEWDGGEWTKRLPATSPPPRQQHTIAYDQIRGRIVLFGGQGQLGHLSDTWEYYAQTPASYATFGSGCQGSAGTPSLRIAGSFQRPWVGGTFAVALENIPLAAR